MCRFIKIHQMLPYTSEVCAFCFILLLNLFFRLLDVSWSLFDLLVHSFPSFNLLLRPYGKFLILFILLSTSEFLFLYCLFIDILSWRDIVIITLYAQSRTLNTNIVPTWSLCMAITSTGQTLSFFLCWNHTKNWEFKLIFCSNS